MRRYLVARFLPAVVTAAVLLFPHSAEAKQPGRDRAEVRLAKKASWEAAEAAWLDGQAGQFLYARAAIEHADGLAAAQAEAEARSGAAAAQAAQEARFRAAAAPKPSPAPRQAQRPSAAVSGACGGATNGADRFIGAESGGNPNARNSSGAYGCYQIMPGTWRSSCGDL